MTGHTGRGVKATAVAAAAMVALTASQGPGAARPSGQQRPSGPTISGDSTYRTGLPPLRVPGAVTGEQTAGPADAVPGVGALPATVLAAYRAAESDLARSAPGCGLRWQLLAAIGQVESGQARGGRVSADGTTLTPIRGPRLDGNGFALIRDSDGGRYDGDTAYDRAVGPMQFIPSTWARWSADGNGDGRGDPGNIFDAALAAGRYLCTGGRDLSDAGDLDRAILGYNHSTAYLLTVRTWFAYYLGGHTVVPDRLRVTARPVAARPRASEPARSPARTTAPDSSSPSAAAEPSPSPSASASPTRPAGGSAAPRPALPVPAPLPVPALGLPGDGVPATPGAPTSNRTDSMGPTPSTTSATGR